MSIIYDCLECLSYQGSLIGLSNHIRRHKLSSKQYYDKYFKIEGEGVCFEHGNNTNYVDFTKGYLRNCCPTCGLSERTHKSWLNDEDRRSRLSEKFKINNPGPGRSKGSKNKQPYPRSIGLIFRNWKHSNHNPFYVHGWTGRKHTNETKQKMSESTLIWLKQRKLAKRSRYFQGRFIPRNPSKYKGDLDSITFRSGWEKQFMIWCDTNSQIVSWSSEETVVGYRSPIDNQLHRYFIDFSITIQKKDGSLETCLIEIKPHAQTLEPKPVSGRKTKRFLTEVATYVINQAKWEAAQAFAEKRGYKFKVITEKQAHFI